MYKHILVPVSFDDDRNAPASLDVAKVLLDEGGKVTLLHVMEQVPQYAISYISTDTRAETKKAIKSALSNMSDLPGAEAVVVEGHSARTILDWAEENKPDCIIVASHRPGMQDYLLGSTAARVVRHAQCAVHVVR
ncbi:universal stress protein [Shimia biformata]|uniref:universal stress protein n=1 Tax=Shimia biformata TaxID=1294299 RepID=UPI00194EF6ED|nr:universal stress protein [Shimia biformata]